MEIPETMLAAAISSYGGPEALHPASLPVPTPGPGELLVRLSSAGVAAWDPDEREGRFAGLFRAVHGREQGFPLVLGSEGAGRVVKVGEGAEGFTVGNEVYVASLLNAKGGMYAEYAAVPVGCVASVPEGMSLEEAGVIGGDASTAVRALEDVLKIKPGESLLVFGASGGLGHLAVQFAKLLGARVLAVASGPDGVALSLDLGADAAIDGRKRDVDLPAAIHAFAPGGVDAALYAAGGPAAQKTAAVVREGGRIAWPNGVEEPPEPRKGVCGEAFDAGIEPGLLARVNALIEKGEGLKVRISQVFPLEGAAGAHKALARHHLGKLALKIS
ncbi:alcohol dehydrogenase [Hyaloraphidium curvatum]|nr:alcohol dehydrogenase [Hyaloraphidium curvatum]